MKLVIHDLSREEWNKISGRYEGWKEVYDNGNIKPCVGCFGCWVKTPGQCVVRDGYEKMGSLIHEAEEVVVISTYTYGCFSSFVKNVFDRSIGWVLPFFEIVEGEMHHKNRYPENKNISFIFRGNALTDEDKSAAKQYVEAACRNFRGTVKKVSFEDRDVKEDIEENIVGNTVADTQAASAVLDPDKIIMLNSSLRGDNANTRKFLDRIAEKLEGKAEVINIGDYMTRQEELISLLASAGKIVLGMPMYVDGVPSPLLRIMERLESHSKSTDRNSEKKIYTVINMGFYESVQIKNTFAQVKKWSDVCGYDYSGGIGIGAGEMNGNFAGAPSGSKGPAKNANDGLDKLADIIKNSEKTEDIYADAYKFPRALYMFMANFSWPMAGRKNGLRKKELYQGA
ncbi:MAG: flavodoxin family protein [Eubacterium sp.]|nr:flavodoxin family protein [Eubacterium sp.]